MGRNPDGRNYPYSSPYSTPVKICLTYRCRNASDQGGFVGDFCFPCWETIVENQGHHSQIYRNMKERIAEKIQEVLK